MTLETIIQTMHDNRDSSNRAYNNEGQQTIKLTIDCNMDNEIDNDNIDNNTDNE